MKTDYRLPLLIAFIGLIFLVINNVELREQNYRLKKELIICISNTEDCIEGYEECVSILEETTKE